MLNGDNDPGHSVCSATLVSHPPSAHLHPYHLQVGSNWLLSASHCLYDSGAEEAMDAAGVSVMLGLHDRTNPGEAGRCGVLAAITRFVIIRKVVAVTKILLHPNFDADFKKNDIALIKIGRTNVNFEFDVEIKFSI